jgi:hypothetical protein
MTGSRPLPASARAGARLGWLISAAMAMVSCAGAPPRVPLTNEWPTSADTYESSTRQWTRSANLSASYQQVISLDATLMAPPWRAARARRDAALHALGPTSRDALFTKARQETLGPWEFELLVTTWDRRENDLHRAKRATWKVVLLDDQGNELEPTEIVRDRRPAHMLRADFPHMGDFAEAYIARFPKDKPVLGAAVKQVRLRVVSVRGAIEVSWRAP